MKKVRNALIILGVIGVFCCGWLIPRAEIQSPSGLWVLFVLFIDSAFIDFLVGRFRRRKNDTPWLIALGTVIVVISLIAKIGLLGLLIYFWTGNIHYPCLIVDTGFLPCKPDFSDSRSAGKY